MAALSKSLSPSVLRRLLLAWYARNKRDLPWRADQDPYRVLVSELMLQQTQVKTVLPYYARFLKTFPDAKSLARAPIEKVLAAWAGLGYYRRARFLHQAAKAVVEEGKFPDSEEGLKALPGVGAYTAAAVGSISFGLPLAVVDGNVIRVISRLLALEQDPGSSLGKKTITDFSAVLLDSARPGDFNQAMMELGALVCTPQSPDCGACPFEKYCKAHAGGAETRYPRLPDPRATVIQHKAVALIRRGDAVLAALRSASGRVGDEGRMLGFWQFPEAMVGLAGPAAAAEALAKKILGSDKEGSGPLGSFTHSVTHHRIRIEAFGFDTSRVRVAGDWQWVECGTLKELPLASAERRMAGWIRARRPPVRRGRTSASPRGSSKSRA